MRGNFFSSLLTINEGFKRCKEIFLLYCVFFLPGILSAPRVNGGEFNDPGFLLRLFILFLVQSALLLYIIGHVGNRKKSDYGIGVFQLRHIPQGFAAFAGLAMIFGILLLSAAALPETAVQRSLADFKWQYTRYSIFPLVAFACFATAYFEELFFRCYLSRELTEFGASLLSAAAAGSLLFAAGHLYQGFAGFTVAFILGLYLSWVRHVSGTVHVPALAHGLYNIGVLLLSGLSA